MKRVFLGILISVISFVGFVSIEDGELFASSVSNISDTADTTNVLDYFSYDNSLNDFYGGNYQTQTDNSYESEYMSASSNSSIVKENIVSNESEHQNITTTYSSVQINREQTTSTEIYYEYSSGSVWIPTNGGEKYHTDPDCSGMINPQYVSLNEAVELGFTPCKKCF